MKEGTDRTDTPKGSSEERGKDCVYFPFSSLFLGRRRRLKIRPGKRGKFQDWTCDEEETTDWKSTRSVIGLKDIRVDENAILPVAENVQPNDSLSANSAAAAALSFLLENPSIPCGVLNL